MAPSLYIRRATYDDLPQLIDVAGAAFGHDALSQAIFANASDEDRLTHGRDWRLRRLRHNFTKQRGMHSLVVAQRDGNGDGGEDIVGWALWQQPRNELGDDDPEDAKSEEQKAREKAEERAAWPACVNARAIDEFNEAVSSASERAVGKEGMQSMWTTFLVAVDPEHQRKGVGKLLMRWGLDQATKSNTDAYIIASAKGRHLYLAMGYEDLFDFWSSVDKQYVMRWRNPGLASPSSAGPTTGRTEDAADVPVAAATHTIPA